METPVDILMKAADYVESQDKVVNSAGITAICNNGPIKENGHSDHGVSSLRKPITPVDPSASHYLPSKQTRRNSSQDEPSGNRNRESMRLHYSSEVGQADETVAMSQYNRNHSNGMLNRIYSEDKLHSSHQATTSPMKSPPRKRSSSPNSRLESEQPAKMPASQHVNPMASSVAQQPLGQLSTNPMIPFVHPFYPGLDSFYAEALARQNLSNSDASRPGASPVSSTSTPSGGESALSQGVPRMVYPVPSSSLYMGPRGPAPGFALPDVPVVFPPQLAAAYGPTAGLLSQQFAPWSDHDKRLLETLASLSNPALSAQLLSSPYLKSVLAAQDAVKDAARGVQKPVLPPGVGLPPGLSNYELLLKYPEVLNSDMLKREPPLSMSPRHSVSPESAKKAAVHPQTLQGFAQMFNPSLTKSPVSDWKMANSTARSQKNDGGHLNFESRSTNASNRRDPAFAESHEALLKSEEARHKLAGLSQRPASSGEAYTSRYNSHDLHSPVQAPYAEFRRRSRDYSPHLSPGDKSNKKRSHEGFGIPRDLIPDVKNHSPGAQTAISGLRPVKSPQRTSRSPMDHASQAAGANALLASLAAGKASTQAADKDNPSYFAPHPYMLHPAFSGFPTLPFAVPAASYFGQPELAVNKSVADALNAASLAQVNAAGSPLFRSQLAQESALPPELARWHSAFPSYLSLMHPQQQLQAMKVIAPTSTATTDFTTALKQTAMQHREKERVASPSHPTLATRRHMTNHVMSPASKLARASPSLPQQKASQKNSTPGLNNIYKARTDSPAHVHDALDARIVKRDPSPPKRISAAVPISHGLQRPPPNMRPVKEEPNQLKRRSNEDLNEKQHMKEASIKRKVTSTGVSQEVDEHFRRSLCNKHDNDNGSNVDDHFSKALGNEVWSKYKKNDTGSSAEVALPNSKDIRPVPATLPPGIGYPGIYFPGMQGIADSRPITSLHQAMASGARTGTIGYSEASSEQPSAPQSNVEARGETKKPVEMRPQPPAYDVVARLSNDAKEKFSHPSSLSPNDKQKKGAVHPPILSSRSNVSPSSGEKPPTVAGLDSGYQSTTASGLHISSAINSYTKSPTRPPPPTYSPHSSTSASSAPAAPSPQRADRQASEDSNVNVEMSVQG